MRTNLNKRYHELNELIQFYKKHEFSHQDPIGISILLLIEQLSNQVNKGYTLKLEENKTMGFLTSIIVPSKINQTII